MTLNKEKAEMLVEYLIDYLDELSGDPDMEECGDLEPNLAGSSTDLEGDDADREPWLSAGTERWSAFGSSDDREIEYR